MSWRVTINLLNASTLVAISGAFRLYMAFLFLGKDVSFLYCIASGAIIYAVYTLDRALECKEDAINRKELTGSRKDIALLVSISAFSIGTFILFMGGLYFIPYVPFVVGYLYSKGIKIGSFNLKLKGGLGVKNFVVALTWGIFITGIAGNSADNIISLFIVLSFFSSKVFINSVIYDFKDAKGDLLAGIKTLPVQLGERRTVSFLLNLHILLHLSISLAIMMKFIAFEPVILLYSFIAGIICITRYSVPLETELKTRKLIREFLIDGESTTVVSLLVFTGLYRLFISSDFSL